jgi:alkaline phosphatase D
MAIDLTDVTDLPESFQKVFYFTVDQWDGYRSERAEILGALAGVQNLVALTGDIHAFYACLIYPDFDVPTAPVCVEYTVAGISSLSVQQIVERVVATDDLLSGLGLEDEVAAFDSRLVSASPHYLYRKSKSNGIALVDVDGTTEIRVTFLEVADVTNPSFDGNLSRVSFRTPSGSPTIEMI